MVALEAKSEVKLIATDPKRRWIDSVALHPDGAVAWSAGKTAFVRSVKGRKNRSTPPRPWAVSRSRQKASGSRSLRLEDGPEILIRRNKLAAVAALAWNAAGTRLAFTAEDGDAGLLDF